MWIFLTVLWVGLQCLNVVFPDHTHLLTLTASMQSYELVLNEITVHVVLITCMHLDHLGPTLLTNKQALDVCRT